MMNKFEITSRGKETRVFYFNEIRELDIYRSMESDTYEREEFSVIVNLLKNLEFGFSLDDQCFYLDIEDYDWNVKQVDKLAELTEDLDDKKPEDKEKIKKIFEEHYIQGIIRQKIVIKYGDEKDLAEMVTDFITDNNI